MTQAGSHEQSPQSSDDLQNRILQLEKLLGLEPRWHLPVKLSPIQHRIFGVLLKATTTLNPQQLFQAVYGGLPQSQWPDVKTVEVHVHNVRKRLKPLGIYIETDWGIGYYITRDCKERAISLMTTPEQVDGTHT